MSFVWYDDPKFLAPYRSSDIKESCVQAHDYYSELVNVFIARLPEHRRQQDFQDWLADEHTLAEKILLIFPNGYGDYEEDKNQNPQVWPILVELSHAIRDGTTEVFAKELCEACDEAYQVDGQWPEQAELLQRIFDDITYFLQIFVTYADPESLPPDFSPAMDFDQWWVEVNQRMAKRHYG